MIRDGNPEARRLVNVIGKGQSRRVASAQLLLAQEVSKSIDELIYSAPLFDATAPPSSLSRPQKAILRKANKLALTALRLAAARKASLIDESILLDATTEALL